MIRVLIERAEKGTVCAFRVEGHARYADPGQDIVCAGVSAVTVGTVNAVEKLTGVEMPSKMKNGFLQASVPGNLKEDQQAQVQLLLESMIVMLHSIEESYGKYIALEDH
ncbi:ribosomal-processing cysteine protease Prp [Paenibacillus aurantius]|uniref:Ribosomal processing cysteine protease Prp n=1 Tax=Paenibacillus aurantius TaxID=2918900 RepID=A0AA96LFS7_9BACL|nr:ribosomal-processing cysteine protease Prp [Paenibacillus aurantius]WNQ12981.1 ribosomal-processing cysteine protease Prp [Paenibacillus aurantius]